MIKNISVKVKLHEKDIFVSGNGEVDTKSGDIFWNEFQFSNEKISEKLLSELITLPKINKGIAEYIEKECPTWKDQYKVSIEIY